ncbi:TetR/AcrR family transcriptional regulator [Actinoplanes xinjiangensis]|uniref:TetR family transcriptional regulator n=1 Tax=Actinoplanes xinjiangensis TaxID=512350 RepID=A0A316FAE4_9ACTN|nr:TetR/AcrR family transcriptional regulator [Actinoplanes xinjiangensis]PWK42597.1 TetR family transcriptional regulator [Actinoplanes xinjiangensis]
MGRVSQAQAAENRERIVATAARLFRERGIAGVSVADVTAEAGLTHGGFYKHFASKDALVAEAVARAFADQATAVRATAPEPGGGTAVRPQELIDAYLSAAHRDDPGGGCPSAGFGGDVARATGGDATRGAYAKGVEGFALHLGGGAEPDLAALSTMVGALILARATAGTELSDRILAAARESLDRPAQPDDPLRRRPEPEPAAVSPAEGPAAGE